MGLDDKHADNDLYREQAQKELDRRLDEFKKLLGSDDSGGGERRGPVRGRSAEKAASATSVVDRAKAALARGNNVHFGHRIRLRESARGDRLLDGFSDVEILELLLSFLIPQKDTNVTAHSLIRKYGSVLGVLRTPPEELARIPSITAQAATVLPLLAYVSVWDGRSEITLKRPSDAADFFGSVYLGGAFNGTLIAYLDSGFGMIAAERTDGDGFVPIRAVLCAADKYSASYVICARRERGMFPDAFGLYDKVRTLSETLAAIDVRLLDFFMFTDYGYYTLGKPPESGGWFPQYVFMPSRLYAHAPDIAERLTSSSSRAELEDEERDAIARLGEFLDSGRH